MVATASPAIEKATARVLKLSKDERARMIHEYEVKAQRDERARTKYAVDSAVASAVEKAEKANSLSIARNMLKRGRPVAEIAEDTGLSFAEIEKLRMNF